MAKSIKFITDVQYLSGKVRRWHTCVGMEQNLADHSHGVAMIIALLHPNPSANLLKAALAHDLGEFYTGDMPSPVKRDDVIRERLKELESEARHSMGIPDWPLTEEEHHWLAFADAYETLLFITYVAKNGPAVSHLEYNMVVEKVNKNATALGIQLEAQPDEENSNGRKVS